MRTINIHKIKITPFTADKQLSKLNVRTAFMYNQFHLMLRQTTGNRNIMPKSLFRTRHVCGSAAGRTMFCATFPGIYAMNFRVRMPTQVVRKIACTCSLK